ncbi:MAG: hypothetical protein GX605_13940 [Chloroflexi bacterium]|nr:hypothetical protein [Chloroflexota bacterium]
MARHSDSPTTFRLLTFSGQWEAAFWAGLLVVLGLGALYLWNPEPLQPLRPFWLAGAAAVVLLVALQWRATRPGLVALGSEEFIIRLPGQTLSVPYAAIELTHATVIQKEFPPETLARREMEAVRGYAERSAVVVVLREWPQSPPWIRKRLGAHFLSHNGQGLLLLAPDWLALHQALDSAIERWRYRTQAPPSARFRRQSDLHGETLP